MKVNYNYNKYLFIILQYFTKCSFMRVKKGKQRQKPLLNKAGKGTKLLRSFE